MNIGVLFYGILMGGGGRTGSERDYRHCWPNIEEMLITPFIDQGHKVAKFVSTYDRFNKKEDRDEFVNIVNPTKVVFSTFEGSDPFTAKGSSFEALYNVPELDVIIMSRLDVHWTKKLADENIDWFKFNFLFREKGWWESNKFACDNLYIWPHIITSWVKQAMHETYTFPRGKPLVDTHALPIKLGQYVPENMMHFISEEHFISDMNPYYTCCRNGLPEHEDRFKYLHPEVKERFYK